jgi:hypothetical protein
MVKTVPLGDGNLTRDWPRAWFVERAEDGMTIAYQEQSHGATARYSTLYLSDARQLDVRGCP